MPARNIPFAALLAAIFCAGAAAQEAEVGFTMPVTLTGGALYTHRLNGDDPDRRPYAGAFHAVLNPSLKLGAHWFVYSSIHVRSTPFFYHEAYEPEREIKARVVQAFVGYTRSRKNTTVLVKAGQLASAFGSFPLRYDDAENPLLDERIGYATYLKLRADQLTCSD
jgi:hypothetical protein